LCFLPLLLDGAGAADFRLTPSIRVGQGWDSNIFATSDNAVSDFYATVVPELAITAASPTLSMQLLGGVEGRWYYDHPEISDAGYSKYLRLTPIDNGWMPTDRVRVSPAAYYLETKGQTTGAFLIPIDPTVPVPGVATYGLETTRSYGASIGLAYQATPVVETAGTVYGRALQYPDRPTGDTDTHTLGADASVRYTFSQRSSTGGYASVSREYFKTTPDATVFGVGLLGSHQISPAYRVDGRLGMAFVRVPASGTDNTERTSNDPEGTVSLTYVDNTFRATLYANFGYTGLSGASQVTRQATVGIDLSDQFGRGWTWSLGGNYQVTQTVFAEISSEVRSFYGSGRIRYAPWAWGAFDLTGNTTRQNSDVPAGDLNRDTIVLGFTLGSREPQFGYTIF
jgi:hypothetical protein